ncbi:gliding motility-associated C-terminal domain-containing protein [Maribacter sp. 2307ULW6-5]|uniref:T9SS type B sorting domain-containing protein n=1 Tax=Maribacter sp. 2307ULW6-5 TaxID=3386275 RepID=UPI0039BD6CF8
MKIFPKHPFFLWLLALLGSAQLSAQTIVINAPEPADNPNLAGNSPWTAICAGNGGFNEYYANISWAGTVNASNQFILELSDASGNFDEAETLLTITDQNSNQDFDVRFAIPETTRGQGYTLRVRSTDPARTGPASAAFNMYFMDVTGNLNISALGDGVPPGSICATGPTTLQVDNIANPETYQYIWFRSGTPIAGETGHTLVVTESGMYNAFVDYGPICTGSGNTDSNIVDVTIGGSGTGVAIVPPAQTALCSTDTVTLAPTLTDPAWNYQWYKDDAMIPGATADSFVVNAANPGFEGAYSVEISGPGLCADRSDVVNITNADAFTVSRDNPGQMVLLPSQTQTLEVSTTANTPTYAWFRNGVEITGETGPSLTIAQPGTYFAAISQTGGACAISTKNTEETEVVAPASFELVIDYQDTYTACESSTAVLELSTINAVATDGSTTDVTEALRTAFTYAWERDGNMAPGASNETIDLGSETENGSYALTANLETYTATSNSLPVQLRSNEALVINATGTVFCANGDTIALSTDTDLSSESYEWQRDGSAVNTLQNELIVDTPGTYRLVVTRSGCDLISNEVVISPLDEELLTLDPAGPIVQPEGSTTTVTAAGATAYRWMDANNNEMGNTSSVSLTEEGTYTLIASFGNCDIVREVQVSFLDTFKVPNVITINGDGINDRWILPNSYANKPEVNVIIYNDQGVEVFNEFDYKNNWPETTAGFTQQNIVFYYKIRNANEVLKQGTITVIR